MSLPDAAFAAQIARETGRALLQLRAEFGPVADARARRALMDAGDQLAQQLLSEQLGAQRPADAVLSEEAPDSQAGWPPTACGSSIPWTAPTSTVRVGPTSPCTSRSGSATPGATGSARSPTPRSTSPRSARPGAPTPAGTAPLLPTHRPLRVVVSRSRPPAGLGRLLEDVSAELADCGITSRGIEAANVGSVGAKLGEVMAGRAEAYLHPGGLNEWDLAAPHACALAHRFVALGPVQPFNRMPPTAGPVLISHPAIAHVLAAHWRAPS